jgi:hypothetical protein
MSGRALAAAIAVLLGACTRDAPAPLPQPGAARFVDGPLYSASDLRSRRILGVHLGMPVEAARRELTTRSYVHRYTNEPGVGDSNEWVDYFSDPSGGSITLSYVRPDGGPGLISALRHDRLLTEEEERQIEARRAEIVAEHGVPSHWFRWNNGGRVGDNMAYVAGARLRDADLRQDVWSCYANWRCTTARGINCRRLLARVREPVLTIAFIYRGVSYELEDYALQYDSLRRSSDFADPRSRPRLCPIRSAH